MRSDWRKATLGDFAPFTYGKSLPMRNLGLDDMNTDSAAPRSTASPDSRRALRQDRAEP